jgi:glycosyltransferase involved in cell wall biosynthesis
MAVLEAMGTGLACVATSVGGIPDVLVEGAGVVVPPQSPEALAGVLADLSRRKGDLPEMGRRAREIVLERYTVEKVLDAYVRVLES